eukprot:scaffold95327_cov18-Tisochrysis_lutea.AAC.2
MRLPYLPYADALVCENGAPYICWLCAHLYALHAVSGQDIALFFHDLSVPVRKCTLVCMHMSAARCFSTYLQRSHFCKQWGMMLVPVRFRPLNNIRAWLQLKHKEVRVTCASVFCAFTGGRIFYPGSSLET